MFRPKAVSPNCVVPALSGLDYFLLPHILEGLLQPGGAELVVKERDAWFQSPMCFVRGGPECLASLLHQQKLGLDLLRGLDTDDASEIRNKYDDYLPLQSVTDSKPTVLGGTRRHIASDQAMRAGGIVGPGTLLPVQDVFSSLAVNPATEDQKPTLCKHWVDPELSETDNEEQSESRRRSARGPGKRKHLLSPSIARSRVMSLSRPSASKRIKTDKLSIVAIPGFNRSSTIPMPSELGARCISGMERPPRHSKYLVNGSHLAALMAVGEVQLSPS